MPDTPTPTPDTATRILLEASRILSTEGAKSQAFAQLLRDAAANPELVALLEDKKNRLTQSSWYEWIMTRLRRLGDAGGVRQALAFFGKDYQGIWKLIVSMLVAALAYFHVPGCSTKPTAPTPEDAVPSLPYLPEKRTQSYFRSRYQGLHVERVTKTPALDGRLKAWDPAGFFATRCLGDMGRHYYLLGSMLADEQALYIGAVVGDPYPMRNRIEIADAPTKEPDAWEGGSIHVFLALRAIQSTNTLADTVSQRTDNQLVRLTLWYSRPEPNAEGTPRLMVSRTLTNAPRSTSQFTILKSDQFVAAYRLLDDGRTGYSLEYRIPWSCLNAGQTISPFGSETVTRGCWEVHWSDATGTTCQGKLTEVVNARNDKLAYETAEAWGEIYFHSTAKN